MLRSIARALAVLLAAAVLAWTVSPWPSALFYRYLMDRDGEAGQQALAWTGAFPSRHLRWPLPVAA